MWEPLVLDAVAERFAGRGETARKASRGARLFSYLRARGAVLWAYVSADLVADWCWAAWLDRSGRPRAVSVSTARNRQWAARAALVEARRLGAAVGDVSALAGGVISRRGSGAVAARPLAFAEEHLVRAHAATVLPSRRALLVALAFSGASATEIALCRRDDIDTAAGLVSLRGDCARVVALDSSAVGALASVEAGFGPLAGDELVCVTAAVEVEKAAHSVTVRLREVLVDAGLADRAGVVARSLRLTTARRVLDADGIEAAARLMRWATSGGASLPAGVMAKRRRASRAAAFQGFDPVPADALAVAEDDFTVAERTDGPAANLPARPRSGWSSAR